MFTDCHYLTKAFSNNQTFFNSDVFNYLGYGSVKIEKIGYGKCCKIAVKKMWQDKMFI